MTLPKKLINNGSECVICGDSECNLMGKQDKYLCEECSTTSFLMFKRSEQLEVLSDQVSVEKMAEQGGEYKDADGVCACPACCFNQMLEIDPILNALKYGNGKGGMSMVEKGTVH